MHGRIYQELQLLMDDIVAKTQNSALHTAAAIREDFATLEAAQRSMEARLQEFEGDVTNKLNCIMSSVADLREGYSLDDGPTVRAQNRARTASTVHFEKRTSRIHSGFQGRDRRNAMDGMDESHRPSARVGNRPRSGTDGVTGAGNRSRVASTDSDESNCRPARDSMCRRARDNSAYQSPSIAVRRRSSVDEPPAPSRSGTNGSPPVQVRRTSFQSPSLSVRKSHASSTKK